MQEWRQDSGKRAECRGVGAAGRIAHQIGLVTELHRECEQRTHREIDILLGRVATKPAQEIVLRDAELGVLAHLVAHVIGRAVEEMRRPFGEIRIVDPACADQRPIDVMLDHAFERPGLCARLQAQRRVEIETVFSLDMGADEGQIGNGLAVIGDVGQLTLGRRRRHRLFLSVGEPGHLELDLGLGHEGADFRQAEPRAEAKKRNHLKLPIACGREWRLAPPCCHHGVSSSGIHCRADARERGGEPPREPV